MLFVPWGTKLFQGCMLLSASVTHLAYFSVFLSLSLSLSQTHTCMHVHTHALAYTHASTYTHTHGGGGVIMPCITVYILYI